MLIQWDGKGLEDATREEEFKIRSQFPQLNLEDEAPIEKAGIVRTGNVGVYFGSRPKIWRVYERRNKGVKRNAEVTKGVTKLVKE